MTKANKEERPRGERIRLSIIDLSKIGNGDGRNYYYVPPYHAQLKERKLLTNGAWMYSGQTEHLIWSSIPSRAIICDFSISEFSDLV